MNKITQLGKYITQLLTGDCSEEKITEASRELNYYNPEDYLTSDKACRFLKVQRDTFYNRIVPKYNLENQKFNNVQIGFFIPDLEKIKKDLNSRK